jgi:exopolysaccharide biosynthesis WecB/TagA/CpsF family protein
MAIGVALFVLGCGVAAACAYLLSLSLVAFLHRPPAAAGSPVNQLIVLVPAHNEAELIGRSVRSLLAQDYPAELIEVVVIADNCDDDTAALATVAGARVMQRSDAEHPGKGHALRWAMDRLLVEPRPPDAVVVVDADSVAHPSLLRELEARLRSGADAVQAEYLVLDEAGTRAELVGVGFLLFHRVRLAGRAALGLPSSLVGNGMLLSRRLLETHPWDATTGAEDLEYTLNLCMAGIHPEFAARARLWGPMPTGGRASRRQRMRWEGGRFNQVRSRLGKLVRAAVASRDLALLSVAADLAVPPLGLLTILLLAGAALSALLAAARVVPGWAVAPWLLAGVMLAGHVLAGLVAARAPARAYLALLRAPFFLAAKLLVYVGLASGFDVHSWERSERPSEHSAPGDRIEVAGVTIDLGSRKDAVARIRGAMGSKGVFQIATINLDFLVRAQVDPEVREIFRRSSLNVADGAPVVWLGRLLDRRMRERVAGADLVPDVCEVAAALGASVFLLGGEDGAASAAAMTLKRRYPELRIAGCVEPPRRPLAEMDLEGMAELINDSGADVLFVAFGHPKQEKWIELNRQRLNVSVAMGVGGTFDFLAGRRRRAPLWMQKVGLEWLFRVAQEPRRLLGRYAVDAAWLLRLTTVTLLHRLG